MEDRSLVLVTGATGAVGPRVVAALHHSGFRIRTLSRHAPAGCLWDQDIGEIDIRLGDINDKQAVTSAVQGVDAVVHLAAMLHITQPTASLRDLYRKINFGGTERIVEAAQIAGVRRVVFCSTIAVYGDTKNQIVDEQTKPHPDTDYAHTKIEAEKVVLASKNEKGDPLGTVLRFAAIYGPRIKGNYHQLLVSLIRQRFIPIGCGRNRRTLIYDKDAAEAIVLALRHPSAAGRIFNVSDGGYHTMAEIISVMCQVLGRKEPRFTLPVAPVRFIAGVAEYVAKILGKRSPVVRATIDKYIEDTAVESTLIQKELNFAPQYDLVNGWRDTVAEMRR